MDPFSRTARWRALGTGVELAVTRPERLDDAVRLAEGLLEWVDGSCSRFRADSDLARANAAAGRWVPVDPLLVDAVTAAVRAAEATGGLVDPTLGGPLAAIGYDRDLDDVRAGRVDPAAVRLPPAPARPGSWRAIGIDPDGRLRVPEGIALDLGAIGKGFAADLIAAELAAVVDCGVVVGLGGDVAVAGEPPVTVDGPGWPVEVGDERSGTGQTVLLDSGGMATSSTRRRAWRHRGQLVHHLLDPATGKPVPRVWAEITVRARSCVDANAASTAAMVLGDRAITWLDGCGLPARLVERQGRLRRTAKWPGAEQAATG